MSKLEKYPAYKDSGVEWLGEIPEGWEVKKLKYLVNKILGGGTPESSNAKYWTDVLDNSYLWVSIADITKSDFIQDTKKYITINGLRNCSTQIVPPYSILYSIYASLGKVAYSDKELTTNQAILSILFKDSYYYKFMFYYLKTLTQVAIQLSNSTTQDNISLEILKNLICSIPPKQEQIKIASFLDEKTEQLDKAIQQKEQLIELLKERRQILINDAVTKGLDKTVAMKDSGVEWIGEIPEGWEVKKLKYIIKHKLKYGANESGIEYQENLPRYVRITDFSNSGKLSEKNKFSLSWESGKDYLLKDGDILFARSGATVGKTYQFKKSMSTEEFYSFAGYLIKAETNEQIILSDFLYLYTNSDLFESWKEHIFNKATIENIGADKYSELFITIPSILEQKIILKQYNIDGAKLDKTINLQQQQITKLKEYKTTLIDSVVTGKVRVS